MSKSFCSGVDHSPMGGEAYPQIMRAPCDSSCHKGIAQIVRDIGAGKK